MTTLIRRDRRTVQRSRHDVIGGGAALQMEPDDSVNVSSKLSHFHNGSENFEEEGENEAEDDAAGRGRRRCC